MSDLDEVITEFDKRIVSMSNLIAVNKSNLRIGMKMAYEDAREMVKNMKERKERGP